MFERNYQTKSGEVDIGYCKEMRVHLNYYLILSLSILIKDMLVEIARLSSTRAICDKCKFVIILELDGIACIEF
jgi:hypothetical protein